VIVLDTNVLSEPLRAEPDEAVLRWIAAQDALATTSVTVAELLTGARRLRPGRRDGLLVAIERALEAYPANVLPYDEQAARRYAEMQEWRRSAGVPLSVEGGMIAAICSSRSHALATRNTKDFEGLELRLIDPWAAQA